MTRNGCHCRVGERSSCARQFELAHVIQSFFYTRRTQTGVLSSVSVCGVGNGGGGTAPCSSLDSCRRSGLAMCLSLDVLPTGCGLECWPCCKPERAGSLLGPFSPHLL